MMEDSRAIQGLPTLTEDNNGWHWQQEACLRLIWPSSQQGSNSEGSETAALEEGGNSGALIMRLCEEKPPTVHPSFELTGGERWGKQRRGGDADLRQHMEMSNSSLDEYKWWL